MKQFGFVTYFTGAVCIGFVLLLMDKVTQAQTEPSDSVEQSSGASDGSNARQPQTDDELLRWLANMVISHGYSEQEIQQATGLHPDEIRAARERLRIDLSPAPTREPGDPLLVLPYPGGRHPRIGFRDGAIDPQRETKASVFTPWDRRSYVVLDVPEAIFTNLGLTYLAHTHIPTIWDEQDVKLPKLEWQHRECGVLVMERELPNGIIFGTRLTPRADSVGIEFWITNGTSERLTDLRMQMCCMLAAAPEFAAQTNDNKVFWKNYAACRNEDGTRWVILAFDPPGRAWGNPPCPCLHSDPVFAVCQTGATVRARGWLSFYEGRDIDAELRRIDATDWKDSQ